MLLNFERRFGVKKHVHVFGKTLHLSGLMAHKTNWTRASGQEGILSLKQETVHVPHICIKSFGLYSASYQYQTKLTQSLVCRAFFVQCCPALDSFL